MQDSLESAGDYTTVGESEYVKRAQTVPRRLHNVTARILRWLRRLPGFTRSLFVQSALFECRGRATQCSSERVEQRAHACYRHEPHEDISEHREFRCS